VCAVDHDDNTPLIAGVAGGVGGALLVIIIIIIIVVCLKKRQYSIQQMLLYYVVICIYLSQCSTLVRNTVVRATFKVNGKPPILGSRSPLTP